MQAQEIRKELIKVGSNYSALGREIPVSEVAVLYIATRRSVSRRIAQAISDKIKRPLTTVFPEYKNKK